MTSEWSLRFFIDSIGKCRSKLARDLDLHRFTFRQQASSYILFFKLSKLHRTLAVIVHSASNV
jgi:hypothetical protein